MEVTLLNHQEQIKSGYTHKIKLTYEDLTVTATATAQTFEAISVAAGQAVVACGLRVVTALSDASDNAFNDTAITVGDGSDPDRFLTSTQLNVNGTEVLYKVTANAVDTLPYAYAAADTIDVVVNSMTGKALDDIDGGEFYVFLKIVDLTEY